MRKSNRTRGSGSLSRAIRGLIDSQRVASIVGLLGLVLAIGTFFVEPVAGAIVVAALILSGTAVGIFGLFIRDKLGGMYELIRDEHTWDLLDAGGTRATLEKHRVFRFLQNDVFAVREWVKADGTLKLPSETNPGSYANAFLDTGGYTNVLIYLDETKNRDDIESLQIRHHLEDCFLEDQEYVNAEISQDTREFVLRVIFPADRTPIGQPTFSDLNSDDPPERLTPTGLQGGRQEISKTVKNPNRRDRFQIAWKW